MTVKTVGDALAEVRAQIASLQAELNKLAAVESYLGDMVAEKPDEPRSLPVSASRGRRGRFQNLLKWEAVKTVLEEANRPLKIGEIIDTLSAEGYGTDIKRNVQHNSIYTTMTRKPEMFVKNNNAEWSVVVSSGKSASH